MPPSKLYIKTKALERLLKEEDYYKKELQDQQKLVNTLKDDKSVDPYELKKHIEVLQDTERLFPSLYQKIDEFKVDLENYLKEFSKDSGVSSVQNESSESAPNTNTEAPTANGHGSLSPIDKVEIETLQPLIDELLQKATLAVKNFNSLH
ncbi:Tubulin-specific chaperone A [Hanseniaspora osmophila]|uniref:Tubulin-specific chaperone A n=1 Tax=Hanseniaspora osmophila TaxID=56408 RepID=A0A1E5R8A0_9ASCO|nr:Tubulin-specific chaperone A [Hanseniaspora osmophila]